MPVQTITRTVRFFKVRVVQADDTVVSGRDREVFPLVHARCDDAQTVEDDWLDDLGEAVTDANVDKTPATLARPDFDWDAEED